MSSEATVGSSGRVAAADARALAEDAPAASAPETPSSAGAAAIRVQNVSKRYQIYDKPQDRLKHSIYPRFQRLFRMARKQYFREFWALRDVSFDVFKGETVGIIGRNGSGKSTLLQVICGTLAPTTGDVAAYGRIAALLELGSGFNPDFTGRENAYLSGAILGLSRQEIDERFDDISDFAGIGDFMDQPVKTYSSGMFVRLAFSVNVKSSPEIMVVDEALAVGDMNFQAKCMTALRRTQERGATVLFVSHDIGAVKSLCSRAVYLDAGRVVAIGQAGEVAERYVRDMREEMNAEHRRACAPRVALPGKPSPASAPAATDAAFKTSTEFDARVAGFRYGTGEARIAYVELLDKDGNPVVHAEFDQEVVVRIHFTSHVERPLAPLYYILDERKLTLLGAGPRQVGASLIEAKAGERFVVSYRTRLALQEGSYSIQCQISEPEVLDETATFLDVVDDAVVFKVARRRGGRIWSKAYVPNALEVVRLGPAA